MEYEKLDLNNFNPPDRKWIKEFKKILEEQNPKNIKKHFELVIHAPHGPMDDQYLQTPSLYSIILYGEEGLNYLYEYIISKVDIFGIALLTQIALKKHAKILLYIEPMQSYLDNDLYNCIVSKIIEITKKEELIRASKKLLFNLVQYFLSNNISRIKEILIGGTLFSRDENDYNFILNLIAQGTLKINEKTCEDLELLLNRNLQEDSYQDFFEKHPEMLDPLSSEIINKKDFGREFYSDFVIRRLDDQYIFIEIEKPSDQLFTKKFYPSQKLSQPMGQILNWFIWVEDNISYAQSHGFPNIHSPKGIIVIGRKNQLTEKEKRQLKKINDLYYPKIEILTYDDILENTKNILKNLLNRIE